MEQIENYYTIDVSIIYVNYRTISLIVNSINSLIQKTNDIVYEIIVIDNNSKDSFSEKLREQFGNLVKCVALKDNIGFGRANNEAYKIAKGRNILFLNPDTIILNNAINILSNFLDQHTKVGACGGNLYDEDMKPTHSYCVFVPSIPSELRLCFFPILHLDFLFGRNYEHNYTNRVKTVKYITGADLMVKNQVLRKCGGFSDDFFLYYEETELCFRIRKNGYEIYSVPQAQIQHLEGKSFNISKDDMQKKRKRRLIALEGEKVFYKLCYSKLYIRILLLIKGFGSYVKYLIAKLVKDRNVQVYFNNKEEVKMLWRSYPFQ
jgi:GT2 family glycosyltransferase